MNFVLRILDIIVYYYYSLPLTLEVFGFWFRIANSHPSSFLFLILIDEWTYFPFLVLVMMMHYACFLIIIF